MLQSYLIPVINVWMLKINFWNLELESIIYNNILAAFCAVKINGSPRTTKHKYSRANPKTKPSLYE